jgi:hypothetical protein
MYVYDILKNISTQLIGELVLQKNMVLGLSAPLGSDKKMLLNTYSSHKSQMYVQWNNLVFPSFQINYLNFI